MNPRLAYLRTYVISIIHMHLLECREAAYAQFGVWPASDIAMHKPCKGLRETKPEIVLEGK
jgi:hypothetical protein